ncbi:MAG: iron ABC transporter permease, partial [Mesorhizobium sp.]
MLPAADLARSPTGMAAGQWTRRRPISWISLAAILVSLFSLLPLAFIIWIAVQTGWDTVSALVFRPRVGELLVNT